MYKTFWPLRTSDALTSINMLGDRAQRPRGPRIDYATCQFV
jgi:hypothetical protein